MGGSRNLADVIIGQNHTRSGFGVGCEHHIGFVRQNGGNSFFDRDGGKWGGGIVWVLLACFQDNFLFGQTCHVKNL